MASFREVLEEMNKTDLIDKIMEICDNGFYPHELIQLKSSKPFDFEELENIWGSLYEKADSLEREKKSYEAASAIADGAEMCFEVAVRDLEGQNQVDFLTFLVDELTRAAEETGIGMYSDDEWQYYEVQEKIRDYLEATEG